MDLYVVVQCYGLNGKSCTEKGKNIINRIVERGISLGAKFCYQYWVELKGGTIVMGETQKNDQTMKKMTLIGVLNFRI